MNRTIFSLIGVFALVSAPGWAASKPGVRVIRSGAITKPLKIMPKEQVPAHKDGPTEFRLRRAHGGYVLYLHSRDPQWKLDARRPMGIQIIAPERIEVQPAYLTELDFKGKSSVPVTIRDGSPGQTYSLSIEASYTVCSSRTKACKKSRSGTRFEYHR